MVRIIYTLIYPYIRIEMFIKCLFGPTRLHGCVCAWSMVEFQTKILLIYMNLYFTFFIPHLCVGARMHAHTQMLFYLKGENYSPFIEGHRQWFIQPQGSEAVSA